MRKFEKLRNILGLLITDRLFDGLIDWNLRCLALDDCKRDSVHEKHDVGTRIVPLVPAFYRELLRHVKHVVFPVLPVDVFQVETEQLAFADRLLITLTQK